MKMRLWFGKSLFLFAMMVGTAFFQGCGGGGSTESNLAEPDAELEAETQLSPLDQR